MTRFSRSVKQVSDIPEVASRAIRLPSPANAPSQAAGAAKERPPVLIMNLFYTGLGIARDLGKRGIRVIGLSAHRDGPGNHTRLCEVRFSPNSQEEPEALVEFLLQSAHELRGSVIFPTRDFDVLFLDRYRQVLEPHYRLAIPSCKSLSQVIDKHALICVARKAGLTVPRTMVVRTAEELSQVAQQLEFPCVVKPVSSHQWRGGANWDKVGGRKAFLVDSVEALEREYAQVRTAHHELLVQEWIPGKTEDIVVLGGYVGANSKPLAYFTARKIIQTPDQYFGTGCAVRSEDIPELLEPTRRLWQALSYRGMAEVEYKLDARTLQFTLIEMNARHWDQHELGRASGVNLSWTAYADLTGSETDFKGVPVVPTTWIAEDPLIQHALRGIYRREFKLRSLWKHLRGPRIYGTFCWRDPWPFVHHFLTMTMPTLGKQFVQSFRKRR